VPLSRLSAADIAGEVRRAGIAPFGRLVAQILIQSPYREARRAFRVLEEVPPSAARRPPSTSSRLYPPSPWYLDRSTPVGGPARSPLLHTPRKALTPRDFGSIVAVRDGRGRGSNRTSNPAPGRLRATHEGRPRGVHEQHDAVAVALRSAARRNTLPNMDRSILCRGGEDHCHIQALLTDINMRCCYLLIYAANRRQIISPS